MDRDKDREIRAEAVRLTTAIFARISPPPLRTVNQVAPIVYALLIAKIPEDVIEQALVTARSHTQVGIDYALRTLMPPTDTASKPRYKEIEISPPFRPSEPEKAVARRHIAAARKAIKGDKSDLA